MRTFYRSMAKKLPFMWWKFFWLRRVQAHLNKEKATVVAAAVSKDFEELGWN